MMKIEKLKEVKNRKELANLLGYKPRTLAFIVHHMPLGSKYTEFTIPKSNGGERHIKAPNEKLKLLQRRLADLLLSCFEEIQKDHRALSHGFRKNYSIITNGRKHRNKRYVFNIDLKDFFPSINFGRVRGFFIKDRHFALNEEVATVIAQIACHDNQLPQGAPTSPIISNLIGHILDIHLVQLAKKAGCTYSRYADDITFSTGLKKFPEIIAVQSEDSGEWTPSNQLDEAITHAGFTINLQKVSMQYQTNRQMVTGLVVNRKVNVRAPYYRQARAMCNALFANGSFYIGKEVKGGSSENSEAPVTGAVNQLRGILAYIYYIKNKHNTSGLKRGRKEKENQSGIYRLYERFIYFDKFHNLSQPLVICEGKTDSVHLNCALKSLAGEFPSMISTSDAKIEKKISFFNYSNTNRALTPLSGGTGSIASFISNYKDEMAVFKCPGKAFPVILLVDNDKGVAAFKDKVIKMSNKDFNDSQKFYHLVDNLYLVVLPPLPEKKEVEIEDYYTQEVRSIKLKGKSFDPDSKEFDKAKHYGKHVFAEKVVKLQQGKINFDRFKPLFDRLEAVMDDYAKVYSEIQQGKR